MFHAKKTNYKIRRVMVSPSSRYLQLRKLSVGLKYMYFISLKVWMNFEKLAREKKKVNIPIERAKSIKRQKIAES